MTDPTRIEKLRVLDTFAGIGGFSLGLERTGGFKTVAFCEIEEYPQRVLRKHWPEVPIYDDIRELTGERLAADGIAVDVITGGFPCQDISTAGKQAGLGEGTRSGLWSECVRLLSEVRPQYALYENVANLLSGPSEQRGGWFGQILSDLASIGYDAEWHSLPASAVGAPHRRDRLWLLTYPASERQSEAREFRYRKLSQWLSSGGQEGLSPNIGKERGEGRGAQSFSGFKAFSWCQDVRRAEDLRERSDLPTPLFRGSRDGVPYWVDRVACLGNAVVPQIPELIGYAILEAEAAREMAA